MKVDEVSSCELIRVLFQLIVDDEGGDTGLIMSLTSSSLSWK